MIVCEIELFYKRAVGALFSRSRARTFIPQRPVGVGILWGAGAAYREAFLRGVRAAGFRSCWRTFLLQLRSGYLSYTFTIFKTKFIVVEKLSKLQSDNSKNENKSQVGKIWLK